MEWIATLFARRMRTAKENCRLSGVLSVQGHLRFGMQRERANSQASNGDPGASAGLDVTDGRDVSNDRNSN